MTGVFAKASAVLCGCVFFLAPALCFAKDPLVARRTLEGKPEQLYLVRVPENPAKDKLVPLCVAVHWFTGTAEEQVRQWGFLTQKAGVILLCPEFANGYERLKGREDALLRQMIEEAAQEFPIDRKRIFLIGYSAGADFAHRFIFRHPGYVLAACLIAGGDYEAPPVPADKDIKIFVAVGRKDTGRFGLARSFVGRLEDAGYDTVFEAYPSVGHELNDSIRKSVLIFLEERGV